MSAPKHLWEIDHPYYAPDGNMNDEPSFAALKAVVDRSDEDMNVVYRWDWFDASQPIHDELFIEGDDRSEEKLTVHLMMPRKSGFWAVRCPVQKHQEFEVLEWLRGPRCLGYLQKLWEPVLDAISSGEPSDRERAIWGHHVTALEQIQVSVNEQLLATRRRAAEEES
jgi:hypothetical protein